jgi:hypothetical protein
VWLADKGMGNKKVSASSATIVIMIYIMVMCNAVSFPFITNSSG